MGDGATGQWKACAQTELRVEGRRYRLCREIRIACRDPIVPRVHGRGDNRPKCPQEKPLSLTMRAPVPQTDTGGQGEDPEVLE